MNAVRSSAPLAAVIGLVALTRLLPHWPNFTPVMAVALCGGLLFANRLQSVLVSLAAMLVSDIALGVAFGTDYALHTTQPWVYACIVATTFLGHGLRNASVLKQVFVGGTVSSVGFFLVTNFAVWFHGSFYPASVEGLMACYAAGLAFYRDNGNFLLNGMLSTYMFTMVIIVANRLMQRSQRAVRA